MATSGRLPTSVGEPARPEGLDNLRPSRYTSKLAAEPDRAGAKPAVNLRPTSFQLSFKHWRFMATSILLYARTGAGKTTQLGLLAEDVLTRSGKKTRIYTSDRGGYDTIKPYVDLGIVEIVSIGQSDIWVFLNKAVTGATRDANGRWINDAKANENIGCYCFESAHGMAKQLQQDMEAKAGMGVVIGGDTNTSFKIEGDGEKLTVGSTKGFQKYAIPQASIANAMMQSQKNLAAAEFVVWTAGVNKDEDDVSNGKIIGPMIIGNALTGLAPGDFNYTFRMDYTPAKGNVAAKHILYLGPSADVNAGNATALGNIRRPLDAKPLEKFELEPANLVLALQMVRDQAGKEATEKIKKRLEAAGRKV